MAEDFLNKALDVLQDPDGFKIGARPIDVSDLTLHRPCACGKKNLQPGEEKVFTTWLTERLFKAKSLNSPHISDRLCNACGAQQDLGKFYRMVCLGCLEVVGRFSPWKDSKTGFEYKAGAVYHVRMCGKCCPPDTLKGATVRPVEFEHYYHKALGRKI
jgi:hypothetical protein